MRTHLATRTRGLCGADIESSTAVLGDVDCLRCLNGVPTVAQLEEWQRDAERERYLSLRNMRAIEAAGLRPVWDRLHEHGDESASRRVVAHMLVSIALYIEETAV